MEWFFTTHSGAAAAHYYKWSVRCRAVHSASPGQRVSDGREGKTRRHSKLVHENGQALPCGVYEGTAGEQGRAGAGGEAAPVTAAPWVVPMYALLAYSPAKCSGPTALHTQHTTAGRVGVRSCTAIIPTTTTEGASRGGRGEEVAGGFRVVRATCAGKRATLASVFAPCPRPGNPPGCRCRRPC